MFFQNLDLTTALRPELGPEEALLFVQDAVGLYEGKFKLPSYQHGHAYLTSHRICYVDNLEPRKNSVAIDLKDIDRYEFYAGFLKSSAKVTIYPKLSKRLSAQGQSLYQYDNAINAGSPPRSSSVSPFPGIRSAGAGSPAPESLRKAPVTWVCPICSFSNVLPATFDATTANEHTNLPPCETCGIKPPLAHLLKAAISSASQRQTSRYNLPPSHSSLENRSDNDNGPLESEDNFILQPAATEPESSFQCPRCTFANHPSLLSCEICGASLVTSRANTDIDSTRPASPGPMLNQRDSLAESLTEYIKISFRAGGEKVFYERLKGAMVQRKWLLQDAPPVPPPNPLAKFQDGGSSPASSSGRATPDPKAVGIAGLERLSLERRKNNETVISSAFEDLEALMASAKEIIALAESLGASQGTSARALLNESVATLGMNTTRDMLGSESLYLSELSRNIAEYVTDDRQAILKKNGGIMSLVDLWAKFNRARNGVELVNPADFEKAARLWESLSLPVRLREFKNGVLVVQRYDWTDDKTIAQLLAWFQEFRMIEPANPVPWDWRVFGRGVTAHEAASHFGWSVGVATEELEMAEEKGVLCREDSAEGIKFWENWIIGGDDEELWED